jgi:hypothetical protein
VRHLGPFAEDFHAAFGLGVDERSIGLLDIDGVNFAAVQALERRTAVQAKQEEVDRLRLQVQSLEARMRELEALVRQLSARQP